MENKVKVLRATCMLQFGYYPNNTVAITAIRISDGEEWCVPTVNYEQYFEGRNYSKELSFPLVVIKNYSENGGVFKQLVVAGVIKEGPYLSGSNGTVQVGLLTPEWQKIAQEQLSKIKKTPSTKKKRHSRK